MQTDTATTTTNAVITNTASNPGTVSFDERDADAFSALSVLMHVLASLETLLVLKQELVMPLFEPA